MKPMVCPECGERFTEEENTEAVEADAEAIPDFVGCPKCEVKLVDEKMA